MASPENYIFGNSALHDRFRLTTQILVALVSNASYSISIAQLQNHTGRSARELEKLCHVICRAALIQPDAQVRGKWRLACTPSAITLEDVFRCVLMMQADHNKIKSADIMPVEPVSHEVDLLIMQATMAVNQSVFKHLRQFSLDRLAGSATRPTSYSKRKLNGTLYDNEHDFEVNAWLI